MAQSKVFVGSLPVGTKPKELRHLFQNFGIVIECDVMNRCGFIHMETPAMAETAILALHGSEFKGQTIVVEPGRTKDNNRKSIGKPMMPNMPFAAEEDIEGPVEIQFNDGNPGTMRNHGGFGSSRRGMPMGNRGGGGMGNQFGNPHRGGINTYVGAGRGGMGHFRGRGGLNSGRGGRNDNLNQNESGPMRSSPNFKSRPGPYPLMRGGAVGFPNTNPRGRKFDGHQRGGFDGPNRPTRFNDINDQQRDNNWNRNENNDNVRNEVRNFRGRGNFMRQNGGQDRRGFTLDHAPQQPQEQNPFVNNRPPMERNNSFRGNNQRQDGSGFQPRFNANMRGRGNFGGGDTVNNNYNQEFPALAPVRGRGGFGGSRGGFNRNAPNMMPNHR